MDTLPPLSQPDLNAELARLLNEHDAGFVVTAYLRQGPLALDVSEVLEQAGITFEIRIVNADTQRTVQPGA